MGPILANVTEKTIAGISVRTNNKAESNPKKAVLPTFWNRFFEEDILEQIPDKIPNSPIYGVYSEYESNVKGSYTVTAGVEAFGAKIKQNGFALSKIEGGEYLLFKGHGPMPEVVANTWQEVWNFFAKNKEFERCYQTDFELYITQEEVEIYIGILKRPVT